jgi:hypothetical protein
VLEYLCFLICKVEQFIIMLYNILMDNEKAKKLYTLGKPIRDEATKRWLRLQTPFLPPTALPKQMLWHIVQNNEKIPTCKMCDNEVNWDSANSYTNQKYNNYCCRQCSLSDPDRIAKKLATENIRYGKGRKEIVKKIKQTNNERYGADYAIQTKEFRDKSTQTIIKKYGVDSYSKTAEFLVKREKTNIERYGVKHPAQNLKCKQKTQETLDLKYDGHQGLRHFSELTKRHYNDKEWMYEQHITNVRTATDIADELKITTAAVLNKLRSFDIHVQHYTSSQSLLEKKLLSFIQSFNLTIVEGDRSLLNNNQELDIYILDKKVAIEFNGIYWHGELQGRDKQYHLNKTEICLQQNIQLLHINESDWVLKQPIIKSIISNKLGKSKYTIYARKCSVVELDNQETRTFLNINHLQGHVNSSINLGLKCGDELVSILTLSKSRFSKKHEYEIYRFCNKLNFSVVGGASKLFNYFIKSWDPNSVITYADRKFGEGKLYEKLGFNFLHNSTPGYSYFKKGQIELQSRIRFQKHKLVDKLETYDPLLTAWENMINNGYDRIWDCGNAVWEWDIKR